MVLAVYYLLRRGMLLLAFIYCLVALTALFATASQAAALVGTAVVVLGVMLIFARQKSVRIGLVLGIVVCCLGYLGLAKRYASEALEIDTIRAEAFGTTMRAALDNLPFGTGFGSFINVYKVYETVIHAVQINHAHNDYLEVALEGGLLGILILAAFLIYIARLFMGARRETLPPLIGLLAILLHSLLDYPLRTFAISVLATFMLLLAERREPDGQRKGVDSRESAYGGKGNGPIRSGRRRRTPRNRLVGRDVA